MVQKQFEKDKKKLEEEVEQEKVKVKETKEEQQAKVTKAQNAFGNIAAATTGASQKLENGQPSAATAAAPCAVLVPTLPGSILHGNDILVDEYQQHMYTHPLLSGITPEMVTAFAGVSLQWFQSKATHVLPAAPSNAEPNPAGTAGGDPKQQEPTAMDADDPFTSDDEENEMLESNKKGDEVLERAKIKRSAKAERTAKKAKAGGVKSTIGK